jgi:hypothetical protein
MSPVSVAATVTPGGTIRRSMYARLRQDSGLYSGVSQLGLAVSSSSRSPSFISLAAFRK